MNQQFRPLHTIAREIEYDWRRMSPYAKPYVDAMKSLSTLDDYYQCDSADDIVRRFLCNAQGWRGETARRVKAELNAMLKGV